ncbi:MAG: hypothetical protein OMM_10731 [Candidatus Magnetoglobus multicellularis str. Araruama]|uniref:Uncharacterized protein n=1 Tax=Candidatus Magnetoglobus multicellularis str. Araruama TaxID=890399 RepID=A0A1V1P079_9BACT|nr:MAG: hypothetical protein OMM_10731 [Candidatus Magnetoglobus multicellularis str. Araruama]
MQLCKNNNETLLDYLTNFDISIEKVNSNLNLEKMCKKINYEPGNDKELENKVFDAYFSTFFFSVRKTRTQEG